MACLFRAAINADRTKFVILKKRSGLHVQRIHLTSNGIKPTGEGVHFSLSQTKLLVNRPLNVHQERMLKGKFLSPIGVHQLTDDSWIIVSDDGKEVILLRKKRDGVKGIVLSLNEYLALKNQLEAIDYIINPITHCEDVEIMYSLKYELDSKFCDLRNENVCTSNCEIDEGYTHECGYMTIMDINDCAKLYHDDVIKTIDRTRLLERMNYLREILKCRTPVPSAEKIEEYILDPDWYTDLWQNEPREEPECIFTDPKNFRNEGRKKNPYHLLLDSFYEIQRLKELQQSPSV